MKNNVIDLNQERQKRPVRKMTDAEEYALEVITLDVTDPETTQFIKQCLGYSQ